MLPAQEKPFTEQDYYQLPEDTRAELIDGKLIYNLAPPPRLHQGARLDCGPNDRGYPRIPSGSKRLFVPAIHFQGLYSGKYLYGFMEEERQTGVGVLPFLFWAFFGILSLTFRFHHRSRQHGYILSRLPCHSAFSHKSHLQSPDFRMHMQRRRKVPMRFL